MDKNTGGGGIRRPAFWHQDLAPMNTYRFQGWDASGQTTNRAGTQTHSSADRQTKDFLNSQAPLDTPLDVALSTRAPRPRSFHKWARAGPSHQEARHQKQESYNSAYWRTKFTNTDKNLPWDQLVPGLWVERGVYC